MCLLNNRFKDWGDMDKLVKYIVEDIHRSDQDNVVKYGFNSIKRITEKEIKIRNSFLYRGWKIIKFQCFS